MENIHKQFSQSIICHYMDDIPLADPDKNIVEKNVWWSKKQTKTKKQTKPTTLFAFLFVTVMTWTQDSHMSYNWATASPSPSFLPSCRH